MKCPRFLLPIAAAAVFSSACLGIPVTVEELGMGANQIVRITSSTLSPGGVDVYAGIVELEVNGKTMEGFCIDPWHWSASGDKAYELVPLQWAPKDPVSGNTSSGMGIIAALQIERLWAQYYAPGMDAMTAAALQVKIWQLVDAATPNGTFSLLTNNTDFNIALTGMTTFLADNPNAPTVPLVGLTNGFSPGHAGQDYVVRSVPDSGTTIVLCSIGLLALGLVRWRAGRV